MSLSTYLGHPRIGVARELKKSVEAFWSKKTSADEHRLERAVQEVLVGERWVNPNCGHKTRGWPGFEGDLADMVAAARLARERLVAR